MALEKTSCRFHQQQLLSDAHLQIYVYSHQIQMIQFSLTFFSSSCLRPHQQRLNSQLSNFRVCYLLPHRSSMLNLQQRDFVCEIRRRDLYKSHDFSLNDFLGRKKLNLMPRQKALQSQKKESSSKFDRRNYRTRSGYNVLLN